MSWNYYKQLNNVLIYYDDIIEKKVPTYGFIIISLRNSQTVLRIINNNYTCTFRIAERQYELCWRAILNTAQLNIV